MPLRWQMLVRRINVLLNRFPGKVADGQHRGGSTLSIVNRVLEHVGRKRGARIGLLAAGSNPEEDFDCLLSSLLESLPVLRLGDGRSRDDTLGMTSYTAQAASKVARVASKNSASNDVVG